MTTLITTTLLSLFASADALEVVWEKLAGLSKAAIYAGGSMFSVDFDGGAFLRY